MSAGLRLARQDIVANHARVGRSQVPYVYTRPQERTRHSPLYDLGGLAGVTAQGDHYPWVELRAEGGSEPYRELGCKIHVELTSDYAALEDRTEAHCLVYKAPSYVRATLDGLVRKYLNFRSDRGPLDDVIVGEGATVAPVYVPAPEYRSDARSKCPRARPPRRHRCPQRSRCARPTRPGRSRRCRRLRSTGLL